ncbi:unnamed protein product, partial [Phaeothamnion confervicola]
ILSTSVLNEVGIANNVSSSSRPCALSTFICVLSAGRVPGLSDEERRRMTDPRGPGRGRSLGHYGTSPASSSSGGRKGLGSRGSPTGAFGRGGSVTPSGGRGRGAPHGGVAYGGSGSSR